MADTITIRLIPAEEMFTIIPFLRVLNDTISEELLRERIVEMVDQDYRCAGLFLGRQLVGICGLRIMTKYYVGRHIEPDNVIILPEYRSRGLGHRLMAWVHAYARSQGCVASELNCYLSNVLGHAFWEAEGYSTIANHLQRVLTPESEP
jgi:GNAT superfamily N-acetyltransferase